MIQRPAQDEEPAKHKPPRWVWLTVKWSLFVLVLVFVGQQAADLCRHDEISDLKVNIPWLLAAGVTYFIGWFPSVWFWRAMMNSLGGSVTKLDAVRSYYCGHLGKYVPGKAMVIVIRAALLKERGCRPAIAALTVTYETLALMGVGLVLAIALAPMAIPDEGWAELPAGLRILQDHPLLMPGAVVAAVLVLLPFLSRLFTRIAIALTPRDVLGDPHDIRIETHLLVKGFFALAIAWMCQGLSLGFTLAALSVPLDFENWPIWASAVSSATAVGFFVLFAPGGLGVREGLLITLLQIQPTIGGKLAVAAALLLRMVWFVTEITVAAALYYGMRTHTRSEDKRETAD
jgi:glycosyltransferase 2 family protein